MNEDPLERRDREAREKKGSSLKTVTYCGSPLSSCWDIYGGTPDDLVWDYGDRIQILWIAKSNVLESSDSQEVFRLALPTSGQTILGALERHVRTPSANFQPMNANFGLLESLPFRVKGKKNRYE